MCAIDNIIFFTTAEPSVEVLYLRFGPFQTLSSTLATVLGEILLRVSLPSPFLTHSELLASLPALGSGTAPEMNCAADKTLDTTGLGVHSWIHGRSNYGRCWSQRIGPPDELVDRQ